MAARYAHINDWTPVNEPLTTARFSGLYELPHHPVPGDARGDLMPTLQSGRERCMAEPVSEAADAGRLRAQGVAEHAT